MKKYKKKFHLRKKEVMRKLMEMLLSLTEGLG